MKALIDVQEAKTIKGFKVKNDAWLRKLFPAKQYYYDPEEDSTYALRNGKVYKLILGWDNTLMAKIDNILYKIHFQLGQEAYLEIKEELYKLFQEGKHYLIYQKIKELEEILDE